jgi:tetratricopeptide (TPR) repeat protein
VVEQLLLVADRIDDQASARFAYRMMGNVNFTSGRHREAQRYYERVLRFPVPPRDREGVIYYNSNDYTPARAMLALALWVQGFTEKALSQTRLSLEDLHGADHQLELCRALHFGICRIAPMIGDFATADREIARLIDVATRSNAHVWYVGGHFQKGKTLVERGEFAQGLAILRDAFETCDRTGWRLSYPEFKGALALALAGTGRLDEALSALNDAMTVAGEGENGAVWYVPELLRIKGEVLLLLAADQSAQAAEDCFSQAGEMARAQDALFWELRIALSVARLRVTQRRDGEAKQILAPVYERFTDGYETTDRRAARIMLDTLPT